MSPLPRCTRWTRLAGLALTLCAASTAAAQSTSKATAKGLEDYLLSLEVHGWSGTVLVESKGRRLLDRGFGLAQRREVLPCTPETLFEVASVTKPFTACAVLALVDQGKIKLDDSIAKHLPGVPRSRAKITVEQLLSHTSGMPRDATDGRGMDLEAAVAAYLQPKPAGRPGSRYEYWNGGYALLAGIVEEVSGKSYPDAMRELVLEPAGMRSSGFTGEDFPGEQQAKGYLSVEWSEGGAGRLSGAHVYQGSYGWQYRGMGGLVTHSGDLHAFLQALDAGKLLKKATRKRMLQPVKDGYGLGWRTGTRPGGGGKRMHHGGDVAGFHTSLQHFPAGDTTIIVLTNSDGQPAWQVGWNLESLLFGDPLGHPAPPPLPEDAERMLSDLVGSYSLPSGQPLELQRWGMAIRLVPATWEGDRELAGEPLMREEARSVRLAEEVVEAMLAGKADAIAAVEASNIPAGWSRRTVDTVWPKQLRTNGALLQYRIAAVKTSNPEHVAVWVDLEFAKGHRPLKLGFRKGRLSGLDFQPKDPAPVRDWLLAPAGKDHLARIDLGTGQAKREIRVQRKGRRMHGLSLRVTGKPPILLKPAKD